MLLFRLQGVRLTFSMIASQITASWHPLMKYDETPILLPRSEPVTSWGKKGYWTFSQVIHSSSSLLMLGKGQSDSIDRRMGGLPN